MLLSYAHSNIFQTCIFSLLQWRSELRTLQRHTTTTSNAYLSRNLQSVQTRLQELTAAILNLLVPSRRNLGTLGMGRRTVRAKVDGQPANLEHNNHVLFLLVALEAGNRGLHC